MNFKELSTARYSLRKFSSREVEPEKLELILKAAIASPTAKNMQPQHIFAVKSPEALEKIKRCTPCHFNAPVILIMAVEPEKAWVREQDGKNYGEIDAALAAAHIMLQAADLGLGTTYVGMFDPELLREEFKELDSYTVIGLFPLGYPSEDAHPARLHGDRKNIAQMATYL